MSPEDRSRSAQQKVLSTWMDQASDGVFVSDVEGTFVDVNRRACEMIGRSRDAVIGLNVRAIVAPEDFARRALALREIDTGAVLFTERTLVRPDGGRFLAELSTTRLDDGHFLAIVRDVTERRAAEESARRAAATFRKLLDLLPDIVLVHSNGVLVYANATAARAFGWASPEAAVGVPVLDVVAPEQRELVTARIRAIVATDQPSKPLRVRLRRTEGRTFDAEVFGIPCSFDARPSVLVVARDLTDRERLESQLVQSERLASVGMLAAGVAHEVNNPLAYMIPNVERIVEGLSREAPDLAVMRHSAAQVLDGARRVQKIVRDLKTFARDDGGRATPVDVNAAAEAALSLIEHDLRFRARVARDYGEVSVVMGSEGRLAQVFLNLLTNSAHAIIEGDAERNEVRVTTRQAGDEVRIEVRDTGVGIAREHLPRLFEPFFTTRPPGVGSGLGLSTCRSIVASLGGRIEVESELGAGAAFTVTLPAAGEKPPSRPPSIEPGPSSDAPRARRPKLLLVDDEDNLRAVLAPLLSKRYDVTAVVSGREALRCIERDPAWDAVLCDLLMSDVTGMDVYERVERAWPELAPRVVFMTGGAFTTRARELLARVGGRWIEKPFEIEDLLALLETVAPR